ncbi:MAG: carboxypeptidase-like regulatory domain-containing protein, partial [Thermoplasmata archaeon]
MNLSGNVPFTIEAAGTAVSPTNLSNAPSYGDWLVGENYSLTAPATVTTGNGSTYFALWYGSLISTNRTVQGNVTGVLQLRACYVDTPGEACQEPGAPGRLRVDVAPANASVTVNGVPFAVNQTTGYSEVWEDDGKYAVGASLAGYYPTSVQVAVSPGNVSYANLTLRPIQGYLSGTVSPADANLTLTPAATVTVATSGGFNATLVPGTYTLTASLHGYASASVNVTIVYNQTSWANLTLLALFGWVNGTIIPSTARLTANDMSVSVASDGSFSLHLAPGPLWLNGSAPGYLPDSLGPLTLDPLGHLAPRLWLPRATGQVVGSVSPEDASVWVNRTSVSVV